ncbi:hypothetical protein [Acidithrix ferrooxidans]|uniref:Uncharacterized protein n=1 Tax=Acidithrix ferrooxidans TaxID=1280514 RepID=A0A0D8HK29_9ACTN|nr:hypothetical protein [Acidithrix ferrooxidans]KJF17441.1 hypothetical protein AXFE_17190 [Acidithrix ferrooxidans]
METTSENQNSGLMIGQPPLLLVPKETLPIGDSAGVYEDERGGAVFIWGNVVYTWGPGDEPLRRLAAV